MPKEELHIGRILPRADGVLRSSYLNRSIRADDCINTFNNRLHRILLNAHLWWSHPKSAGYNNDILPKSTTNNSKCVHGIIICSRFLATVAIPLRLLERLNKNNRLDITHMLYPCIGVASIYSLCCVTFDR